MTNELWTAFVGAVVLLITNLALLVKVMADNAKTKADRAETKEVRDKDSADLHDAVQKNTWDIGRLKDENAQRDTILDSLRCNVNELNTNLLLLSQKLEIFSNAVVKALHGLGGKEG
ncbi:MAG: hypothetical protein IKB97_05775 [Bacteroidaceae bacterium]|nr:hypothetical protein [Fibrobacter sp.]MBR2863050.1 hypothetical protein [Bacteroidaceae bacterium]MBR6317251.1 hypothetical protein [Fibrobacter sp.]